MIKRAEQIASIAYTGKRDRSGKPYIHHPRKLAAMVEGEEAKTVAWLQGILAETDYTASDLAVFFPQTVVEAVIALTRDRDESYEDYLARLSLNPLAVKVKMAELNRWADLSAHPDPSPEERDWAKRCLGYRDILVARVEEQRVTRL